MSPIGTMLLRAIAITEEQGENVTYYAGWFNRRFHYLCERAGMNNDLLIKQELDYLASKKYINCESFNTNETFKSKEDVVKYTISDKGEKYV